MAEKVPEVFRGSGISVNSNIPGSGETKVCPISLSFIYSNARIGGDSYLKMISILLSHIGKYSEGENK